MKLYTTLLICSLFVSDIAYAGTANNQTLLDPIEDGSGGGNPNNPNSGVTGTGSAGQVTFWTGTTVLSGDADLFWDNTNKMLGIGTASPTSPLSVDGNADISGLLIVGTIETSGNIIPSTDNAYTLGTDANRWESVYVGPGSYHLVSTAGETGTARDFSLSVSTSGPSEGFLSIGEASNSTPFVTMDPTTGFVGIDNTAPLSALDVTGDANISGHINAASMTITGSVIYNTLNTNTITTNTLNANFIYSGNPNLITIGVSSNPDYTVMIAPYVENGTYGETEVGFSIAPRIGTDPANFNSGILAFGGFDANHLGLVSSAANANGISGFNHGTIALRNGDNSFTVATGFSADFFSSAHSGPFHASGGGSATSPVFQMCNQLNANSNAYIQCAGISSHAGTPGIGLDLDSNGRIAMTLDGNQNTSIVGGVSISGSGYITGNSSNVLNLPTSSVLTFNGIVDANTNTQNIMIGALNPNYTQSGPYSIWIGHNIGYYGANTAFSQVAIGDYANPNGPRSVTIGTYSQTLGGGFNVAVGTSSIAGYESVALLGNANSGVSVAIGKGSQSLGGTSTAVGGAALANGQYAAAYGYNTVASTIGAIAIGGNANSLGAGSISIGLNSFASNSQAISIGQSAFASNNNSIAIGFFAQAGNTQSVAIGTNAKTTANNQIVLGTSTETVVVPGNVVASNGNFTSVSIGGAGPIGGNTSNSNTFIFPPFTVFGTNGRPQAGGNGDIGNSNQNIYIGIPDPNALLAGIHSIFIGYQSSYLSADNSNDQIEVGYRNQQIGQRGISIGYLSVTSGTIGTAVGADTVSGAEASAFGGFANANFTQASAFGWQANANNTFALALGNGSLANGSGGVAAGFSALTQDGVAIGQSANSNSPESVSIGGSTQATALQSIAAAYEATASGIRSSSYGYFSNCSGSSSSCFGAQAVCAFTSSTAIGEGAMCTAANQIILGLSSQTVVAPGSLSALGNTTFSGNVTANQNINVTGSVTINGNLLVSGVVHGSTTYNISTQTGTYNVLSTDYTILADASGGAAIENLPAASSVSGRIFNIKKVDSSVNTVTLQPAGVDTIDGSTNKIIVSQYTSITIQSNGSGWFIL